MFAILEILPENNTKRSVFSRRVREAEIFLEEIQGESFKKYYIVRARKQNGSIPWEKIEEICGPCKKRLLIQENIVLPKDSGLCQYIPSDFPAILMINTAKKILQQICKKNPKISCALIDKNAIAAPLCEKLLPYIPTLNIFTENLKKYYDIAEIIYHKFGASLIISDENDFLSDVDFIVSLNNDTSFCSPKSLILNFYAKNDTKTLSLGKIDIPKDYYLPPIEGIRRFDFICALYELANAKKLADSYCNTLFYNSREISIKSASDLISACLEHHYQ